ncbi:penicillin acylase family protein [soil metagenome]
MLKINSYVIRKPVKSKRAFINGLTALGCLLSLALISAGLGRSFDGLSPIGDLIAPSRGFWRHRPTAAGDLAKRLEIAVREAGLKPVDLQMGDDEVPHLKSESEDALYFAQGFVTAYYRLWQMDLLSRLTAGRVSELLGPRALPVDRFFRRMRLPAAGQVSADMMMADVVTRLPLMAYTRGVNARLAQMDLASVPIEYRMFGILPEPWTEDRAAHLQKFMTWELTGYLYDFRMTASKAKLSQNIFELLFPLDSDVPGTILNAPMKPPPLGKLPAKVGNQPPVRERDDTDPLMLAKANWSEVPDEVAPDPSNGSNNWAVPARMMANHRALLSNDLHLGYSLPALWFSIQLTTPTMNVYGASLPGAPGVMVGFTESAGWAVTNGSDDVLDWYSLRFRDEKRQEYLFEDSWRPVVTREETIKVAGAPSEVVKTRETHVGPIVFDEGDAVASVEIPSGLAAQWIGYTPSNSLKNFLLLNHAETVQDCMNALKGYVAPSQNFICADRSGKLAYKHAGVFPDRKQRDGRFVYEAARDADLWQGTLSPEENPVFETTTEPIVTANQAPFNGPQHRFGWFFAAPYRALQIRSQLESKKQWKPEEMISLQADTTSWLGVAFKKILLREAALNPKLAQDIDQPACGADASAGTIRKNLEDWKGDYSTENRFAPVVDRWMKSLEEATWTRIIGSSAQNFWPLSWRFYQLIENEPQSPIWDDPATRVTENLGVRLDEALILACDKLKESFGAQVLPAWSDYQVTTLNHLARVPGFGKTIQTGGVAESIFANKGAHGPTWKMIVSFEDKPKAWTMIPGGQSGDPSSPKYESRIEAWSRGEMQPVQFNLRDQKTKVERRTAK